MEQILEYGTGKGNWRGELRAVYRHTPLLMALWRRELSIRYAQTSFGLLWAVLPTLFYLLLYSLFFSVFLRIDTQGIPYPVYAISGLIGWNFFRETVATAGSSLIQEAGFLKKNPIPRLIIPLYKSGLGLVEYGVSLALLLVLLLVTATPLRLSFVWLPLLLLLNWMLAFGVAIWACLLSLRIRDALFLLSSIINMGIWLTPVFYSPSLIPQQWQFLLAANPMAGMLALYRWALLGEAFSWILYAPGLILGTLLFLTGIRRFIQVQDTLTDFL